MNPSPTSISSTESTTPSTRSIQWSITPKFTFSTQTLQLETNINGRITQEFINLKERVIRQTLVALGWSPPEGEQKTELAQAHQDIAELNQRLIERQQDMQARIVQLRNDLRAAPKPAIDLAHKATEEDPYQSEAYQRYVAEAAKTCLAKDAPCDACLAGGICDGPGTDCSDDHDDHDDHDYSPVEPHHDEDGCPTI